MRLVGPTHPSLLRAAMERHFERIETRFEVVWAAGSLDGVGVLRNLSGSGAWIDEVSVQPPMYARILIVILEDPRDPLVVEGVVVRRTTSGFAVGIYPANSDVVRLLLDRLAAAGLHGLGEAR